jgi:DNA-binding transcriptional MerR regulator
MADSNTFEVPQPSEKLSFKFILDSVRENMLEKQQELEASDNGETAEPTQAEIPAEVLASPEEELCEREVPISIPELPELPAGKKYFRIGEVSEAIGVEPYVLRYWEGEFSVIRPTKSGSGHRVYARKDVETLLLIKHLLHEEKFSIKGAKKQLAELKRKRAAPGTAPATNSAMLRELAHDLKSLIQLARTAL